MTPEEIRTEVKDIIATIAPDEDLSALTNDGVIREQIDLDSMDFLDIIMELRKRHKIEVPEEDYKFFGSLDSCAEYLAPKMQGLTQ
ncbi:MAG: acyl carrier protein [Bdellovibrionales bacterium]|nr:acyl carrier protein [Bdellovibrionales bacterium]